MNHTPHVHSDWKVIKLKMVWRGTAAKIHTKYKCILHTSTYYAGPLSTCFLPQCQRQSECFFEIVPKIVTQRKSKRCLQLSHNLIGLLSKMSVSDWLLHQGTAPTRILNEAKRPQS